MKPYCKNCLILFVLLSTLTIGQTLQTNFPVTNGIVYSMAKSGSNIFLGGNFTYAGPNTGRGVGIDPSTGNYITGFPDVNGSIYIVVSDGAGGWYIGGNFTQVGGVARSCLAHIKSDKSVDTWNPNINDAGVDNVQKVITITKYGSTIYVGGLFTYVGSAPRTNVAAIDSATGLANSWNPSPDSYVYSIVVSPQYTFLGGSFTYFGGATDTTNPANDPYVSNKRQGVAELFTGTTILTQWYASIATGVTGFNDPYNIGTNTAVYAMQLVNGRLYCAGNFSSLGGNNTCGLTSIDTMNTYTPLATGWGPNKNNTSFFRPVYSMAISGDSVFAGGAFGYFGTASSARTKYVMNHIALALISTGLVVSTWNPNVALNITYNNEASYPYYVSSIVVANGIVYASGKFDTVNTNVIRNNIFAINQSGTGTVTSWNPSASDAVTSVALQGSSMYAGGNFTSMNGQIRNNLCEINALSGTVTSWNPNANANVQALAFSGTTLFVGGLFTNIGGMPRQYLAGIDTTSGLATTWQANANISVYSLLVNGGKLYVGGYFTQIGGSVTGDSTRNRIASIDTAATAGVSSWNPNADQGVTVLSVSGSTIYVSGGFFNIGGQARYGLAALDAATGLATSWNPNVNSGGGVKTMAIFGSTMYVGGIFTNIGGAARNNIASISIADTGTATTWNPNITALGTLEVDAIAVNGSTIYAGGYFDHVGSTARNCAAAIDASTGSATSWNPNPDSYVYTIIPDPTSQLVYMGGGFSNILNATGSYFGVVTNPGDAALPVELTTFNASLNGSTAELRWTTATEVNSYGFEIEKSTDNNNFNKIGFVHGAGNSSSPKTYSFTDYKINPGVSYYRLKQLDNNGQFKYSTVVELDGGNSVHEFSLNQNYPNPFNPTTVINYEIPKGGFVSLKVYDIIGREVSTLVNQLQSAGKYSVTFNGSKLSSGIYFYKLQSGSYSSIKKLILLK